MSTDADVIRELKKQMEATDAKLKEYSDAIVQAAKDVKSLVETRQVVFDMLCTLSALVDASYGGSLVSQGCVIDLKEAEEVVRIREVIKQMRTPTQPDQQLLLARS